MIKATLLTTIGVNVGDDWIREGLKFLLGHVVSDIRYEYVNFHRPRRGVYDAAGRDRILTADLVAMAGTPFYFISPRRDPLRKAAKVFFSFVGRFTGFSRFDGRCSGVAHVRPIWYKRVARICESVPVLTCAAGTNLHYYSNGDELVQDRFCRTYITDVYHMCRATTTRDPLAHGVLKRMGLPNRVFPCTAFWAIDALAGEPASKDLVLVNYMPGAAHRDASSREAASRWETVFRAVYESLRRGRHRVVVVCHDRKELEAARRFAPRQALFFHKDYSQYLKIYARGRLGLFNRCHGLIALASAGSPGIVVGTDTRTQMADMVGLARHFADEVNPELLLDQLADLQRHAHEHADRLHELKAEQTAKYIDVIRQALTS